MTTTSTISTIPSMKSTINLALQLTQLTQLTQRVIIISLQLTHPTQWMITIALQLTHSTQLTITLYESQRVGDAGVSNRSHCKGGSGRGCGVETLAVALVPYSSFWIARVPKRIGEKDAHKGPRPTPHLPHP